LRPNTDEGEQKHNNDLCEKKETAQCKESTSGADFGFVSPSQPVPTMKLDRDDGDSDDLQF
jgi:hypothetical protein